MSQIDSEYIVGEEVTVDLPWHPFKNATFVVMGKNPGNAAEYEVAPKSDPYLKGNWFIHWAYLRRAS